MINKELVTIIIPAYNVESTIEECIESLIKQTYSEIEIIIINDGSTDSTESICESLRREYDNITIIYQDNKGVSFARNVGLCVAKGNWIVFLDADDKMESVAIEKAVEFANDMKCDTVCWNCYTEQEDGILKKYPPISPINMVYQTTNKKLLIEALYSTRPQEFYPGQMFRAVWGKLLSRILIENNNLSFPISLPLGEDAAFLFDYFQVCNKVLLVNNYWNYYKVSSLSTVGRYKSDLRRIQERELEILFDKCSKSNMSIDMDTIILNQHIQFDYQFINNLYKKESSYVKMYIKMLANIKDRQLLFKKLRYYNTKKINKKSILIAWCIVNNHHYLEAILCILKQFKQSLK